MIQRINFDPPVRAQSLTCRYCRQPLEAVAEIQDGLLLAGCRRYDWRHAGGKRTCTTINTAAPYDAWQATTAVEAVQAAQRAIEDGLDSALRGPVDGEERK